MDLDLGLGGDDDHRARAPLGRRQGRGVAARLDDAAVAVAVRTGVTPRAVVGLVAVAVLVAAVLGGRVLLARSRSQPVPLAPASATTALAGATSTPSAGATAGTAGAVPVAAGTATPSGAPTGPAAGAGAQVVVHVVGQVRRAGVVRLPAGARVEDALEAAGGATHGADLAAVNLARLLVDGEQVVVPRPGQAVVPAAGPPGSGGLGGGFGGGSSGGSAAGPSGAAGGAVGQTVVDLNTATVDQLDALPGVGPVLAGRIVDWRTQHGRFTTPDELGEVSGIGDKVLERLRPLVRV